MGPRSFDPVVVGNRETDARAAYYLHDWRRFLVASVGLVGAGGLFLDPARAARLEVEWWRIHRAHQHSSGPDDQLEEALVDLYAYVYDADPEAVRPAARKRVEAMDLSDRWVKAGCHRDDPLLAGERRALVASYAALRNAVEVRPGHH